MSQISAAETLSRIREALDASVDAISSYLPSHEGIEHKPEGQGPVTEADRVSNRVLRECLLRDGEGWLSEETIDDLKRLAKRRVWVVDPLDGTRDFIAGIPEWCVSVAMVEDGYPIAGGICNPATGETFLGTLEAGITYNSEPAQPGMKATLEGAVVLASRSEVTRGEWQQFQHSNFEIRPTGSVAYKLALVAAGLADATWTLAPKNEWDVAAGVALIQAGGGIARSSNNAPLTFNNRSTLLPGIFACGPGLYKEVATLLRDLTEHLGSNGE